MSWRRLPRGCGTVVWCDGEGCDSVSYSGQIHPRLHRHWLRTRREARWGRGALRATKHGLGTCGDDLCPVHLKQDRTAVERRARSGKRRAA